MQSAFYVRIDFCGGDRVTLNLSHWVPEGMVLCSDSMVTLTNYTPRGPVITNFEHAEKLVPIGDVLPAAVMINGWVRLSAR
jgi:hypothetical protein